MSTRPKLTDEQRKTLEPILDQIEQGFDDLANKLSEMGVPPPEEPSFTECLRCDCEGFVSMTTPGRPCARPGCGHRFAVHNVW